MTAIIAPRAIPKRRCGDTRRTDFSSSVVFSRLRFLIPGITTGDLVAEGVIVDCKAAISDCVVGTSCKGPEAGIRWSVVNDRIWVAVARCPVVPGDKCSSSEPEDEVVMGGGTGVKSG